MFYLPPVSSTSCLHKSHKQQKYHIQQLLYCIFGPASQTDIHRPDAVKQNLINVNYKWKTTTMLSEIDTTHNRLEEDREREER